MSAITVADVIMIEAQNSRNDGLFPYVLVTHVHTVQQSALIND